ncbi:MAG: ABC transporter ATP-binding protein [Deltaproteobacteria bacterium CG12_big_fil_rev_8_21_14_0_65_43_10]|nr:MAG: ABC transporter ATP-binding protein [Deltaproteobacteria bacterium CG2_30_43_15]PIQ44357.1 MAG: ABC transporter ATP-binding protein [Deltaproteobacteria bacterium CG12_big_fil_rev_8_21_14_0_65_43_10]PIU85224.1 MAG: ABC transporter ATP-binding protein [Deltaproteobacteria bacterium CG06_land_8_20_14_3_00_44_19]PIX22018.1 MAG: ABC transporter ATP-binding protein [Deltaproteobacteria bacterium CG_4_8_14_3_um_filter_43_13]PIZ20048.1 MAG: ABC transporter ATP-binding protein [Deltaproteobacte
MLLHIKELTVHYEGAEALNNVTVEVEEGSVVTIIGANGAGKTTLLRAISGLEKPVSGEIWFKGDRIDGMLSEAIARKGIGHCPEGRRLFPFMTVLENLKMGAYSQKNRAGIEENIHNIYKRFPILKERARQKAGTLSGGEQQMLAIGRALMGRPILLLLDEPSLGLSPLMVNEIKNIVTTISKEMMVSILLIEQNSRMALSVADYGYVLETGRVRLQDKPESLMTNDHVRKAYLGEEL